jgi:hypothetical protein
MKEDFQLKFKNFVKRIAKHAKWAVSFRIKNNEHAKLAVSRNTKFRETASLFCETTKLVSHRVSRNKKRKEFRWKP